MLVDQLFQYRISPWPKTAEKRGFCTCVTDGHTDGRTDGRTGGRTDRPSYRDALLTDASKKHDLEGTRPRRPKGAPGQFYRQRLA